jgi:thiosulfate reductase cytochrome b subunit
MNGSAGPRVRRHSAIVRATHWVSAIATIALIVSGVAILLAHPRLYWGETGAVGTPSLIDLPVPFLLGHSGWGRYLHFLAAWVAVASGVLYLIYGVVSRHFNRTFLPSRDDLRWSHLSGVISDHLRLRISRNSDRGSYNVVQRLTYATFVFVLGPLILLSGLAFSPALASVMPALVEMFGGQQSARTIHFFGGAAVVIFLIVHVVMVWLTGFNARMRAMITGRTERAPEDT